ncbi:ABC transporter permease [Patescibacteria group bacterium]|nr:ABC transporter permease [Patescibacteria group bacterium]
MFVSFYRALRFAGQNFWRNIWLSVVTVTILTLSIFSVSILGVINTLSNVALNKLEEKIDISVYLKPELKTDDIQLVKTNLESIPGVKSVAIVPAEEALKIFKEKYQNNPLIAEALLELGTNPLGSSLTVKALTEEGYTTILNELEGDTYEKYIQETRFEDYRTVIQSFAKITDRVKKGGLAVSLLFIIISLLVVFNTIRMNIYTHREELGIMRLVGATSWFIRAPLLIESLIYAFLATAVTSILFYPLLTALQPYISSFFNGYDFNIVQYFTERWFVFFGSLFLGSAVLSMLASTVAMRRYLKV